MQLKETTLFLIPSLLHILLISVLRWLYELSKTNRESRSVMRLNKFKMSNSNNGGGLTSLIPSFNKKTEVVVFSSTAIALYGYDQGKSFTRLYYSLSDFVGMMSLINTNSNYLETMQISKESTIVGVIVSVYYIGCAIGAVIASWLADKEGRKPSIFICLATTSLGNLLMFISGLTTDGNSSPWSGWAIWCMLAGRVVMGLGVGGIDAVIPVCECHIRISFSFSIGPQSFPQDPERTC